MKIIMIQTTFFSIFDQAVWSLCSTSDVHEKYSSGSTQQAQFYCLLEYTHASSDMSGTSCQHDHPCLFHLPILSFFPPSPALQSALSAPASFISFPSAFCSLCLWRNRKMFLCLSCTLHRDFTNPNVFSHCTCLFP